MKMVEKEHKAATLFCAFLNKISITKSSLLWYFVRELFRMLTRLSTINSFIISLFFGKFFSVYRWY
ncbi:hypothetical protein Hanom_Chr14g01254531 [Helianthus anomalus]